VSVLTTSHEFNPHEFSDRITVRDTMEIVPDYPDEELSLTIFRQYEVEVVDEVKEENNGYKIYPPEKMPKPGSNVYIPSKDLIMEVMGLEKNQNTSFDLGKLNISLAEGEEIPVNIKRNVIQRHVFIGGTTGGGKSYAARVLAEEINKHGIPIIFFDTQYEFVPLTKSLNGKVFAPGKDYWVKLSSLTESEILDLVPTVRHELHVSLLVRAFLSLKEGNPSGISQQSLSSFEGKSKEKNGQKIDVNDLIATITRLGPEMDVKQPTVDIVVNRTRHYLSGYNFLGYDFDWEKHLNKNSIICIDCKDYSRQALQLILASTLRELTELRTNKKTMPFVIFIDEAHLFVPQDEDSPCKQIIRETVRIGRHHGICAVLITQSPLDIDKKAIRQCNTRLLFAIEPDQLQSIQGVKTDATAEMLERLPKSPVGSCILTGTYETIKHAIPVKIREMEHPEADAGKAPDIFAEVNKDA